MELQWPLILFTTFLAWSAGLFATQGILSIAGKARKSQMAALITSVALLVIGGIAVFAHLQHWERIFNGFGHLTSGITQELIIIVIMAIVMVIYFVMIRRTPEEKSIPNWIAITAIVVSALLVVVMAHSYNMSARPAWDSVFQILAVLGNACIMGPATMAAIMALKDNDVSDSLVGKTVMWGAIINCVTTILYLIIMWVSGAEFDTVGYYFDPANPTLGLAGPEMLSSATVVLTIISLILAVVSVVTAYLGQKKATAQGWKTWGTITGILGLICVVCLRCTFYLMGISVFAYF